MPVVESNVVVAVGDRIGTWMLGRDIERRIAGFAAGCRDEIVLVAADGPRRPRCLTTSRRCLPP
jgi:hypothetical protein